VLSQSAFLSAEYSTHLFRLRMLNSAQMRGPQNLILRPPRQTSASPNVVNSPCSCDSKCRRSGGKDKSLSGCISVTIGLQHTADRREAEVTGTRGAAMCYETAVLPSIFRLADQPVGRSWSTVAEKRLYAVGVLLQRRTGQPGLGTGRPLRYMQGQSINVQ